MNLTTHDPTAEGNETVSDLVNVVSDPAIRQAIADVVTGMAPEGVCEVCREADDTVSCPCSSLVTVQMCEHCHWMTCPEGGDCW